MSDCSPPDEEVQRALENEASYLNQQIGNRFQLPMALADRGKVYQFVAIPSCDHEYLKRNHPSWTPTIYDPSVWAGYRGAYKVIRDDETGEGYIEIGGLVLMEKDPEAYRKVSERFSPGGLLDEQAQAAILKIEAREDERCKALVCEAVARRALGGNTALFNANSVQGAWQECKDAYDDVAFRNANREAIIARAKQLARRAGQTPDLMVSTEAPVPCRLEGMQLWFFNEARLLPLWRLFEPLAIVQVREEQGR